MEVNLYIIVSNNFNKNYNTRIINNNKNISPNNTITKTSIKILDNYIVNYRY